MNKQKKAGILTFHIAHNFGAMLQAYALPTAVKKIGIDCEIIDYRFAYIDNWSRIDHFKDLVFKFGYFWGTLKFVWRKFTGYYGQTDMHHKFDYFERRIIPHSKKVYRHKSELDNMPYDIIIFGSDQIWNSALTDGIADEYVGNFKCLPKTRKISYAASCGMSDFQLDSKVHYESMLKDFYAISVREEGFQKTLKSNGYNADLVLDPTLLLTEDDWSILFQTNSTIRYNKYLLLYVFDEDETIYDLARTYASDHNLEIIVIAYTHKERMYDMHVLTDCGPLEFLELFKGAEHIITSSFHGTVFSLIFHKNFHCISHPKYHERTDSLLRMLELEHHNIKELGTLNDITITWERVDEILKINRDKSFDYLKRTILENGR